MNRPELFKNLEQAQESIHATERSLLLLEKKLLSLADNDLVSPSILGEISIVLEDLSNYRIIISKIWRDIILEYRMRTAD